MKKGSTYKASWGSFWYFSLIPTVTHVLTYANSWETFAGSIGFGIIGTMGLFVIFALYKLLLMRRDREISIFELIFIGLLLGFTRGLGMILFAEDFGLIDRATPTGRLIGATLVTAFWFSLIVHLREQGELFQARYKALRNQVELYRPRQSGPSDISPGVLKNLNEISEGLRVLGQEINSRPPTRENLLFASSYLRGELLGTVRPFSHELWGHSRPKVSVPYFVSLLSSAFLTLDFKIWQVLGIHMLFLPGLWLEGAIERNFFSLISLAIMGLFMVVYAKLPRPNRKSVLIFRNSIFLVFSAFLPPLASDIALRFAGYGSVLFPVNALTFTAPVIYVVIILANSMVLRLKVNRIAIVRELEDELKNAKSGSEVELAGFLHNTLQSELTALAMQLEAGAIRPDSQEALAAWERIGGWISRSVSEDFENFRRTPNQRLAQVVQAWNGIAQVELDIPSEVLQRESISGVLVQLVEESISNSVRHLSATKIRITFSREPFDLLTIETNGVLTGSATKGLGFSWINSIALEPTKTQTTEFGTKMEIAL